MGHFQAILSFTQKEKITAKIAAKIVCVNGSIEVRAHALPLQVNPANVTANNQVKICRLYFTA